MFVETPPNSSTPAHNQRITYTLADLAVLGPHELDQIIADQQAAIAANQAAIAAHEAHERNYRKEQDYLRRTDIDDAAKLAEVIAAWEAEG